MPVDDAPAPDREVLTWDGFGSAVRDLATGIAESGWLPDVVVAVARGGLNPAGAIAYALDVKAMGTLNVEFYTGVGETLDEPVVLPPFFDTSDLPGDRVLVVDDVADSGRTLAKVVELLARLQPGASGPRTLDVRSAVLFTKSRSVIAPDFSWKDTDQWISFPWSAEGPVPAALTSRTTSRD